MGQLEVAGVEGWLSQIIQKMKDLEKKIHVYESYSAVFELTIEQQFI